MEKLLATRPIRGSYDTYLKSKDEKTTALHCFGEFIDNAIAARKKNEHITIDISFIQNSNEYYDIIVADNAPGMDAEHLAGAMIIGHTSPSKKNLNSINAHHEGMKIAAFWFSNNVLVYSKVKNGDEVKFSLDLSTEGNIYSDPEIQIYSSSEQVVRNESGTIIKLLNCYKKSINNCFDGTVTKVMESEQFKRFLHTISWRYSKFIYNEELSINFEIKKNGNDPENILLDKKYPEQIFKIKELNFNEFENSNKNNHCFDIEKYKNHILEHCNDDFITNIKDKYGIENIVSYYLEGNNMEFTHEIQFSKSRKKLTFGILADYDYKNKYTYNYVNGIAISQNDRYICHGITTNTHDSLIPIQTYKSSMKKNDEGRGIPRLYGDIDLTGVAYGERNKRALLFDLETDQKKLDQEWNNIKQYFSKFTEILINAEKVSRIRSKNTNNLKPKNIYENIKVEIHKPDTHSTNDTIIVEVPNIITINIQFDPSSPANAKLYSIQCDDKNIKLIINENHLSINTFLVNQKTRNDFISYLLVPQFVVYALLEFYYDHKKKYMYNDVSKGIVSFVEDNLPVSDFLEKINDIIINKKIDKK